MFFSIPLFILSCLLLTFKIKVKHLKVGCNTFMFVICLFSLLNFPPLSLLPHSIIKPNSAICISKKYTMFFLLIIYLLLSTLFHLTKLLFVTQITYVELLQNVSQPSPQLWPSQARICICSVFSHGHCENLVITHYFFLLCKFKMPFSNLLETQHWLLYHLNLFV